MRLTRRALELYRSDPRVLTLTGFAIGYLGGLRREPRFTREGNRSGPEQLSRVASTWLCLLTVGKPAVAHFERALRLNPRDARAPFAVTGLASAHLYSGNFFRAAELAEGVGRQLQNYPPAMLVLIAAYAHAGEIDKAKRTVQVLLQAKPEARVSTMLDQSSNPDYVRLLEKGFQLAGLPE